jgi:hypothetical protein
MGFCRRCFAARFDQAVLVRVKLLHFPDDGDVLSAIKAWEKLNTHQNIIIQKDFEA